MKTGTCSWPHGRNAVWWLRLFVLILLGAAFSAASAQEKIPNFTSHLTDLAGVMGERAEAVDSKLKAFEAQTGHQVFVLTVPTMNSGSVDEFALRVFETWKIGRKGIDDGVLFVVSIADRKMRIEVGYGLEGALTDAKSARIISEAVLPLFAEGAYGPGIELGVGAILNTITLEEAAGRTTGSPQVLSDTWGTFIFSALLGCMFLAVGGLSLLFGIVGLALISVPGIVSLMKFNSAWEGQLFVTAVVVLWLSARWALVAKNVRKYHLKQSRYPPGTWVWVMLFTCGTGAPKREGERCGLRVRSQSDSGYESDRSSSFGSSDDTSDSLGGAGGRSGGAGASSGW